jgi:hypothetical protein
MYPNFTHAVLAAFRMYAPAGDSDVRMAIWKGCATDGRAAPLLWLARAWRAALTAALNVIPVLASPVAMSKSCWLILYLPVYYP